VLACALTVGSAFLLDNVAPKVDGHAKHFTSAQEKELLDMHNKLREGEGASDMTQMKWNTDLEKMAQDAANKCQFAHTSHSEMSNKFGFRHVGQNIYVTTRGFQSSTAATNWFNEKNDYTYSSTHCAAGKSCGHYTQLVWAQSTDVGCATTWCDNIGGWNHAGYIIFCNYGPGGNFRGHKPFQKGTACSQCPSNMPKCTNNLCHA